MIKMFVFIKASRHSGSGLQNIYSVWQNNGWASPKIVQKFKPERTTLILNIGKENGRLGFFKRKKKDILRTSRMKKSLVIDFLTDNISASLFKISKSTGIGIFLTKKFLDELVKADLAVAEGKGFNKKYKLKS